MSLNTVNYEGIGNLVGIDTHNIIKDESNMEASKTWTATEDCWVTVYITAGSGSAGCTFYIDNINSQQGVCYVNSGVDMSCTIPLKCGQTLSSRAITGATYGLRAYGLKY